MAKSKMSDDMRRLTTIKAEAVWCPLCKAKPNRDCRGIGRLRTDAHDGRRELARLVGRILRASFEVAERPCNGDAHKPEVGGNIDHCMVCAPGWGVVKYLVPKKVPAP